MNRFKKFSIIFLILFGLLIPSSFAVSINTNLNNASINDTRNNISNNNSNNFNDNNVIVNNSTPAPVVSTSSAPSKNTGLTISDIIDIIVIAVGVVIILLGIAILIRFK